MPATESSTIAYFTVVHDDAIGWVGGLLALDANGRPVEFQCTLPVRPTRTHEILFGATLKRHVICDVIGSLLVQRARTPMALLCCDQIEAIHLQPTVEFPVGLVVTSRESESTNSGVDERVSVDLAGSPLVVPGKYADAVRRLAESWHGLTDGLEPFERIRGAISEAQSQLPRAQTSGTQMPGAAGDPAEVHQMTTRSVA